MPTRVKCIPLFFYSIFFGIEISYIKEIFNSSTIYPSNNFNIYSDDQFLLILIPGLLYIAFKAKNIFLRSIYLVAILPLLLMSSIFPISKEVFLVNVVIIFIIDISLLKYIIKELQNIKSADNSCAS